MFHSFDYNFVGIHWSLVVSLSFLIATESLAHSPKLIQAPFQIYDIKVEF